MLDTKRAAWFAPLAEGQAPSAYRFAVWLLRDRHLAEETVQEALTRLWKSNRTPGGEEEFRRFLFTTVGNLARDHGRRERVRRALRMPRQAEPDAMAEIERRLADKELAAAVATLPMRDRRLVYLRFVEDLSYTEIAAIVGAQEGALRVSMHRTLARLRSRLTEPAVLVKA